MQTIDYQGTPIRRWEVGPSAFLACPEKGARLLNWNISLANGDVRDVLYWPQDEVDMSQPGRIRGGNPILFPFCARSYDEGVEGWWRTAEGTRLAMPRHGFARDGAFRLLSCNASGFTAVLVPDEGARIAYPYDYEFTVAYLFKPLSLRVTLQLTNHGKTLLPWSAGHHFYFQVPWHRRLARKDYLLHLPAKKAFYAGADGSLAPVKDFEQTCPLSTPGLNERIHCKLTSNQILLGPAGGEENIGITVGLDPVPKLWASIVTWAENDDSPYYCVEPWMSPPNAHAHKNGLHLVEPGRSDAFTVEVALL